MVLTEEGVLGAWLRQTWVNGKLEDLEWGDPIVAC